MNDFVAIDFETANCESTSICSVGAIKVRQGVPVSSFYRLVRPYPNYYLRRFTDEIHGISRADTDNAPTFDMLWPELRDWLEELPLVAHNAAFDSRCLTSTLRYYGLADRRERPFLCTLQAARRAIPRSMCGGSYSLPYVAQFLGIPFTNHHNALADAQACAAIAMAIL